MLLAVAGRLARAEYKPSCYPTGSRFSTRGSANASTKLLVINTALTFASSAIIFLRSLCEYTRIFTQPWNLFIFRLQNHIKMLFPQYLPRVKTLGIIQLIILAVVSHVGSTQAKHLHFKKVGNYYICFRKSAASYSVSQQIWLDR